MRTILTAASAVALFAVVAGCTASPSPKASAQSGTPTASLTSSASGATMNLDLQSHRGGRGEWTEESLAAFGNSLKLGVTTLELDTHLSEDGSIVVWHDDLIQPEKCQDTAPVTTGDVDFPYVGDRVADLTLAQLKTLNCGFMQLPNYPDQQVITGNRMAELKDVYQLARDYEAKNVRFNVETKVEEGKSGGEGMVALTRAVVAEIQASGMQDRTTLQSFDWSSLNLAKEIDPSLILVALSSGDAWAQVGQPGKSPDLGGIDIDDYNGSLAQAAAVQGYDVISPAFKSVTPAMIREAHDLKLAVIPWTVNTQADMENMLGLGVDGIITDYPTRLRALMDQRGMKLPKAYQPK
ncbi:glycerophosphodiester phosphodiesterase family protein [Arthrobacter sp. PAMC25284]|uniref:glycerophosphodiester phosphodiesterase family protein n=1 Tax=Arthrobacter sp. PAMC25284 TaxID=2861279 RepID=UPI001C626EE8|nr:glycerophosphodiester phosphodiesterase family protein [Arthrobacter sp. PAMC25284]QYF91122.1 glycerophosphodiester phosphodiesterase [Arthrobacter sp. PAMC25284]